MCSDKVNSILASQSESDMKTFRWKNLMSELSENAPVFPLSASVLHLDKKLLY